MAMETEKKKNSNYKTSQEKNNIKQINAFV